MNISGGNGDDDLTGTREADALNGFGGSDTLRGRRGADELDGGLGIDLMIGGTGDDTYWVDDAGDHVRERLDEGFADLVYSTVDHRLFAHVENLILWGTADIAGYGNDLANIIIGNSGANLLDGRGGSDRLEGRGGDDVYVVDNDDTLVEFADGGIDTVRLMGTLLRLSANIENVIVIGDIGEITVNGNASDNVIDGGGANESFNGGDGNDTLYGRGGRDVLQGGTGDNLVYGGEGNDTLSGDGNLDGGNGDDRLTGTGILKGGNGNDNLTGSGALDGGNGSDVLTGGTGDDTLRGGVGEDLMTGGAGMDRLFGGKDSDDFRIKDGMRDRIYFDTRAIPTDADHLGTYDRGLDQFYFDNDVFTELGPEGALAANAIAFGPATTPEHRILVMRGSIYYDPDGSGAAAAQLVIDLSSNGNPNASDFFVY